MPTHWCARYAPVFTRARRSGGHERIVTVLLEAGAALWMRDVHGFNPWQVANRYGYKEVGVLLSNWQKKNPDCMVEKEAAAAE